MRTVAQLPGHPVLFGFTVLQQRVGVAAVPAVVSCSEQSVQPEDQVQSCAVGEGVEQIYSVLCGCRQKVTFVIVTVFKQDEAANQTKNRDNVS